MKIRPNASWFITPTDGKPSVVWSIWDEMPEPDLRGDCENCTHRAHIHRKLTLCNHPSLTKPRQVPANGPALHCPLPSKDGPLLIPRCPACETMTSWVWVRDGTVICTICHVRFIPIEISEGTTCGHCGGKGSTKGKTSPYVIKRCRVCKGTGSV